jgi:outer membrane protein assembly factor BamB
MMGIGEGAGKLPDLSVSAMAEDHDGHIWIGTAKGIAVFYNPQNIFTGANFDSQQIKITQDGHVQLLLETERVTAITIDGANRKWIGTEASGVYCFSPDGQEQIYHFSTDNSPIFSNQVVDIGYDTKTGDVFIGTDMGMQSFRTYIIEGEEEFNKVHAYPNPVRPGYTGNVYVKGLIDEAVVKITDVSGNLVWETKSQGGQIEWPLKSLSGKRVASGVYLAYCAATDGTASVVAKILVLN